MIFLPSHGLLLPVVERDGHDYVGPGGRGWSRSAPWPPPETARSGDSASSGGTRNSSAAKTQAQVEGKTLPSFHHSCWRADGDWSSSGLGHSSRSHRNKAGGLPRGSRRLFVGKVAVRFTEELRKDSPPVLVLTSPLR